MSGIADAIRLREFTNTHPQVTVEDANLIKAPRTGHTVGGLYVCQVGRVHPFDPSIPMDAVSLSNLCATKVRCDLSFPDISEVEPVTVGPWNRFETSYSLHFPEGVAPIDKRYTPTSHKAPLPIGAKSPPSLGDLNPHLVRPPPESNNSRDWNKIAEL